MGINSNTDWCWFVRSLDTIYSKEAEEDYEFVIKLLMNEIIPKGIPCEFIYDAVANTTNLVIPKDYIASYVKRVILSAGFKERAMPSKDEQSAAEFKEALLQGSNFNTRWM